jgi:hypothetical protein
MVHGYCVNELCSTCGDKLPTDFSGFTDGPCIRCTRIEEETSEEFIDWVRDVVKTAIENHTDRYYHNSRPD